MPVAPFLDPTTPPDETALAERVGKPLDVVNSAIGSLGAGRVSHTWRSSKTSGWYLTYDRAGKRLFYLFPQDGDLLLKLVFNGAGVQALHDADLPEDVREKLASAKVHAEGTLLEFTAGEITTALLTDLLRIKVGSMR